MEDQEKINEFGRINNLLLECRADMKQMKEDKQKLEDANADVAEVGLTENGKVMILIGETFVECDEETATECMCNLPNSPSFIEYY